MRAKIVASSQYAVTVFAFVVAVVVAERAFGLGWPVFWISAAFVSLLTWTHALAVPGWPRKLAIRSAFLLVNVILFCVGWAFGFFLYDHSKDAADLTGLVFIVVSACVTAFLDKRWNGESKALRL